MKKILKKEIAANKDTFIIIIILMICGITLEVFGPLTFKVLIDNVFENQYVAPHSTFGQFLALFDSKVTLGFFVVFAFFFSRLLQTVIAFFEAIKIKKMVKGLIYSFSKTAFNNMEMLTVGFYRNQAIGDYIYRLSYDVSSLGELVEQGIFPLINSLSYFVIVSTVLFLINAKLALLSFIALPFLAICLYIINRKVVIASKKSEYWNSAVFSFLHETLMHLKVIQAYSREKSQLSQFHKKFETYLKSEYDVQKMNFFMTLLVSIVIAVCYSFIIGTGIIFVFEGTLSVGFLIVFIFYLINLTNPLLAILYAVTILRESHVRISRVEDFFKQNVHVKDTGTIKTMQHTNVAFEHVSLQIEDGRKILDDITVEIPEGKITAVIGMSGSGKTSLVSLIPRLINEPTAGKIFLGGHPLHDYQLKTLRENIAYVPQEIVLFNTTIGNIIGYGKDHATHEEVKQAAKLAAADEFIQTLPGKYDFKVGEGGNFLSVGQRQRLMLARAYIKQAPLIILDEVFSSQDPKTRLQMVQSFKKSIHLKTIILVSNIFEIVAEADMLIVVHDGKFIRSYTHEELIKRNLLRPENIDILLLGESK